MPPIDPSLIALLGYAVLLSGAVTQFLKRGIELVLDPVKQKAAHDLAVQGSAAIVGTAIMLGLAAVYGPGLHSLQVSVTAGLLGIAAGLAAIGNFSLLKSMVPSAPADAATPAAPSTTPAAPPQAAPVAPPPPASALIGPTA